jgi:hypothetical protein
MFVILGCGRREDPEDKAARERERVAGAALKESMEKTLALTRSLEFKRVVPIPDGLQRPGGIQFSSDPAPAPPSSSRYDAFLTQG